MGTTGHLIQDAQFSAVFIYNQLCSWKDTADAFGVPKGILYNFVFYDRVPRDIENRVALGIACKWCHGKHLPQKCQRRYKPISDRTKKELLWSLANRK